MLSLPCVFLENVRAFLSGGCLDSYFYSHGSSLTKCFCVVIEKKTVVVL